jgi:hypothetical protein
LVAQLAALHRRIRQYAGPALRGEPGNATTFLTLLREIIALRPEVTSVALESSSGSLRSAAARSAMVALVAELQAARTKRDPESETSAWAARELLRRDDQVRQNLLALRSGRWPLPTWRAPLYRSYATAAESGVRAAAWFAIASAFFVSAGWPAASVSLSFVALFAALGTTTPNPRALTVLGLVGAPIAIVLTGMLEFIVLDGADAFPLLAIALAPFTIGAAVLLTSRNLLWSSLGRVFLSYMLLILAPNNPQTYNPQAFLFTSLFIIVALALLLVAQTLIPPVSDEKRRVRLLAEARRELQGRVYPNREAPEEAMFRDASRIEQFLAAGGAQDNRSLAEMLSCFDQSTTFRLCDAKLMQFATGPLAVLADEARAAIVTRDAPTLRAVAGRFRELAPKKDSIEADAAACLVLTSDIVDASNDDDFSREAA